MRDQTFRALLEACDEGRRVIDLLPVLPTELTRGHMKVLNAIRMLGVGGRPDDGDSGLRRDPVPVTVSDVADALHITRPSITKLITQLERRGDVSKIPDERDRRIVHVALTAQGGRTYRVWVEEIYGQAAHVLEQAGVGDAEAMAAVRTIGRVREAMERADLERWQRRRLEEQAEASNGREEQQ